MAHPVHLLLHMNGQLRLSSLRYARLGMKKAEGYGGDDARRHLLGSSMRDKAKAHQRLAHRIASGWIDEVCWWQKAGTLGETHGHPGTPVSWYQWRQSKWQAGLGCLLLTPQLLSLLPLFYRFRRPRMLVVDKYPCVSPRGKRNVDSLDVEKKAIRGGEEEGGRRKSMGQRANDG